MVLVDVDIAGEEDDWQVKHVTGGEYTAEYNLSNATWAYQRYGTPATDFTGSNVFYLFRGITIPQGSTIDDATLTIPSVEVNGVTPMPLTIRAVNNSAPTNQADYQAYTGTGPAFNTPVLTPVVTFSPTDSVATDFPVDVKAHVQALVNAFDYSNDNMLFRMAKKFNATTTQTFDAQGFEYQVSPPDSTANLTINYTGTVENFIVNALLQSQGANGACPLGAEAISSVLDNIDDWDTQVNTTLTNFKIGQRWTPTTQEVALLENGITKVNLWHGHTGGQGEFNTFVWSNAGVGTSSETIVRDGGTFFFSGSSSSISKRNRILFDATGTFQEIWLPTAGVEYVIGIVEDFPGTAQTRKTSTDTNNGVFTTRSSAGNWTDTAGQDWTLQFTIEQSGLGQGDQNFCLGADGILSQVIAVQEHEFFVNALLQAQGVNVCSSQQSIFTQSSGFDANWIVQGDGSISRNSSVVFFSANTDGDNDATARDLSDPSALGQLVSDTEFELVYSVNFTGFNNGAVPNINGNAVMIGLSSQDQTVSFQTGGSDDALFVRVLNQQFPSSGSLELPRWQLYYKDGAGLVGIASSDDSPNDNPILGNQWVKMERLSATTIRMIVATDSGFTNVRYDTGVITIPSTVGGLRYIKCTDTGINNTSPAQVDGSFDNITLTTITGNDCFQVDALLQSLGENGECIRTYTDDFSSNRFVDKDSNFITVSSNRMNFEAITDNTNDASASDISLEGRFGSVLPATWRIRFSINFTSFILGDHNHMMFSIGDENENTNSKTGLPEQSIGFHADVFETLPTQKVAGYHKDGVTQINTSAIISGDMITMTGIKYYQMERTSDTSVTYSIFSDAGFTTLLGSITQTIPNLTGLQYFKVSNWKFDNSTEGNVDGFLDDLEIVGLSPSGSVACTEVDALIQALGDNGNCPIPETETFYNQPESASLAERLGEGVNSPFAGITRSGVLISGATHAGKAIEDFRVLGLAQNAVGATGTLFVTVRNENDVVIATSTNSVLAETLPLSPSNSDITFTFANKVVLQDGYRVLVEFPNCIGCADSASSPNVFWFGTSANSPAGTERTFFGKDAGGFASYIETTTGFTQGGVLSFTTSSAEPARQQECAEVDALIKSLGDNGCSQVTFIDNIGGNSGLWTEVDGAGEIEIDLASSGVIEWNSLQGGATVTETFAHREIPNFDDDIGKITLRIKVDKISDSSPSFEPTGRFLVLQNNALHPRPSTGSSMEISLGSGQPNGGIFAGVFDGTNGVTTFPQINFANGTTRYLEAIYDPLAKTLTLNVYTDAGFSVHDANSPEVIDTSSISMTGLTFTHMITSNIKNSGPSRVVSADLDDFTVTTGGCPSFTVDSILDQQIQTIDKEFQVNAIIRYAQGTSLLGGIPDLIIRVLRENGTLTGIQIVEEIVKITSDPAEGFSFRGKTSRIKNWLNRLRLDNLIQEDGSNPDWYRTIWSLV